MNIVCLKEKLTNKVVVQSLAILFAVAENSVRELLEEGEDVVRFDWHYLERKSNPNEEPNKTVFTWEFGVYPHVERLGKHFSNNLEFAIALSEKIRLPLIIYAESPHPYHHLLMNRGKIFFVKASSDGYADSIMEVDAIPLATDKIREAWSIANKRSQVNRPLSCFNLH